MLWVFPEVTVCLQCGFADFAIPERERKVLASGIAVEGALISDLEGEKRKTVGSGSAVCKKTGP